jgi:protein involved in polysaccharide export with SLBB domain
MEFRRFIAIFLVLPMTIIPHGVSRAAANELSETLQIRPPNVAPRANAEYYPSSPDAGVTMPVHIWGNVREPGLHYMPLGANLGQTVSAAGGPTDSADMTSVRLLRGGKPTYVDLLGPKSIPVQSNDYIYVDRNYRADMPLIMSGITTVLSIITLYFVVIPRK